MCWQSSSNLCYCLNSSLKYLFYQFCDIDGFFHMQFL